MLDIFEILGPVMVGPSSSHTAGAVRIGNMARTLLGGVPKLADIGLHGSFAETGLGHGTDRALIAGLLGMKPDNMEIPHSFELAAEQGLRFQIHEIQLREAHPNTAVLELTHPDGHKLKMQACSTGGGRILVNKLDDIEVEFTGAYHTLVIRNRDDCGYLADVTTALSRAQVNIANMQLCRRNKGGAAMMVIETDQPVPPTLIELLGELEGIEQITYYEKEDA
ncbi:MAG: L-serine ammonia-lyase, iron-sulfur-dependent subunit beta [Oscillospiraceae bacterium]